MLYLRLPYLSHVFPNTLLNIGYGITYSYLFKIKPQVIIKALVITEVSRILLFALLNPLCHGNGAGRSIKVLIATNILSATVAIPIFRQMKFIGTLGTSLWIAELICTTAMHLYLIKNINNLSV